MTNRLYIDIIGRDKTKQALTQVQGNLNQAKTSVINLKNALISLGVGAVLKSFVDVGKAGESLQVRFKFLFGSLEEGAIAFDNLTKFAARVPFSLEEISRASGNLAVVAKDADDLNRVLEITGNVAAVTGLDFETTASQIQRSFAGGIGAADLFRERGVRALLGFKAGVNVTAEDTIKRFEELFSGDGKFAGATKDLAQTLEGTLSMIGDKYFKFQKEVASNFFDELKKEFGALDKYLADNEKQIEDIAEALGKSLAFALTSTADGIRFVNDNFETFKRIGMAIAVFTLSKGFISLSVSIGRTTLAMLTLNRKALTSIIGALVTAGFVIAEMTGKLDELFKLFEKPKTFEDLQTETELLVAELSTLKDTTETVQFMRLKSEAVQLKNELEELRKNTSLSDVQLENIKYTIDQINKSLMDVPFREISLGIEETTNNFQGLIDAITNFKTGMEKSMASAIDTTDEFQKLGSKAFDGFADSLTDALMTGKANFKDFARSLLADLLRIIIRQRLAVALQNAMGFGSAVAGGGGIIASIPKLFGFANGGTPPVNRPSIVGEKGAELFLPKSSGTIIPNEKLPQMAGTTNINFTINTVDARGVDELLTNRRSTIINVINDALNRQGKEALV